MSVVQTPPDTPKITYGSGKFIFPNGGVYAGEWVLIDSAWEAGMAFDTIHDTTTIDGEGLVREWPALLKPEPTEAYLMTERGQAVAGAKQRHGFGRYQHGRELYIGWWVHDSMHGRGRFESSAGCYEGGFMHGRFHGRGCFHWPSGAWYSGDWADNKMHGQGSFTASDGRRWVGTFCSDHLVSRDGRWVAPPVRSQAARAQTRVQ